MADLYTVFIIDGAFVKAESAYTDCIRFSDLGMETVRMLLELATDRGFDVVVRLGGDEEETEG